MVRVIGMLCLVAGFLGLSLDKIKEEKEKIKVMAEIRGFVGYMLKEIEYSHIPIPDICREYLNRSEGKMKPFLENVCKEFENNAGKSFDVIWEEETEKYMWRKEEKLQIQKLSKCFGFCNIGMQLSSIEQYLQEIEKILSHKEKKFQDNRKLILYFGVMSGLLLSIILL